MSDPILHIKDSYFFEVPKFAWQYHNDTRQDFPDVWVKLDPQFQDWEADRFYTELQKLVSDYNETARSSDIVLPPKAEMLEEYHHWKHHTNEKHEHENLGKPFHVYLKESLQRSSAEYETWKKDPKLTTKSAHAFTAAHRVEDAWLLRLSKLPDFNDRWKAATERAGNLTEYRRDESASEWSKDKIEAYNYHLSGKVLIPQYFGKLRNLHEPESGLCISKFMIIELLVALIMFVIFRWLAVRISSGTRPRGRVWNLLETFLVFIREQIAHQTIGHHDGDRFVPLLWTIFMFILGCNLFGLIPGFGSPTGVWGVTLAMAIVTFGTVIFSGMRRFGVVGFFTNQVPHMELPFIMALIIKPMVFVIEILGMVIKHTVLSIRLLANMLAGHMVILGMLGMVFGLTAAMQWNDLPTWQWSLSALSAVIGSAVFSCLELFVAFLQAYVFTLLSGLFIGAAIHHH